MTTNTNQLPYRIARRAGQQGARTSICDQVEIDKLATGPKSKLLKCRQITNIVTFNTRTLRDIIKPNELAYLAEKYEIDVMCIQEHRIYHDDVNIKYHDIGKGWVLVTSSATKAENNATIGGVGLLLSPKAFKSVCAIENIDSRIIIATFNGNPLVTIISCYSPTNSADEDLAIEFYSNLSSLVRDIPKHNVKIIGGDMNAKIGKSDCKGSHFHEQTNRNGKMLIDFMNECDLIDLSTKYCKRKGKLDFYLPKWSKSSIGSHTN